MTTPVVYVDHSEVPPGRLAELRSAVAELAAFVEANEPQLLAYDAYLDEAGTQMTVIHVHRDAASLDRHLEIARPRFGGLAGLVKLRTIEVYGAPSRRALDQLREKAALLGGGSVTVHRFQAGLVRLPGDTGRVAGA